ncbi:hypothetical protein [Nostoc sp. CHAB 5715]|uniref:hypothetical protein n=1 Tax=Nostoc sp. CHAB 5715 TaxID=2780400 RepID=UPI001E54342A|nr:hypothetical protein [Nostoc sp. CHAB 5715]MCC5619875.1 hypothetical protein [Nostoc sp. CHAB 5715]
MGYWALGIGHPFSLLRLASVQVAQGKWALGIDYSPYLPHLPHPPLPPLPPYSLLPTPFYPIN